MAKRARRAVKVLDVRQPLRTRVLSGPGGVVRIEYSRPLATLNLPAADARAFAQALLTHAMRAEIGVVDAAP
jgi:hypothetical protein